MSSTKTNTLKSKLMIIKSYKIIKYQFKKSKMKNLKKMMKKSKARMKKKMNLQIQMIKLCTNRNRKYQPNNIGQLVNKFLKQIINLLISLCLLILTTNTYFHLKSSKKILLLNRNKI